MLFDIQVNGALGFDFSDPELRPEHVRAVVAELARHRVSHFLPTIITSPSDVMLRSIRTIAACPEFGTIMPGYHLEGPWISPLDGPRGAHPLKHVREPDWDEFQCMQDAAGGRVTIVTIAPEVTGGLRMIERLAAAGVVVAIGHTAASPATLRDAATAGARLSTHLGNGCAMTMHRHENVLWEQLADDRLMTSIIADGHHLPAALVKTIVRAKGVDNVILVSDASPLAGSKPGRYWQWGTEIVVSADGRVGVANTPYLAGSGAFLDECVGNVQTLAGVSDAQAMQMASDNPRRLLKF